MTQRQSARREGPSHVIVMAKSPSPGRVKTRLCPPCSPDEAAAVAEAALADTLQAVAGCGADRRIVVLDGPPGRWLPAGFDVVVQRGHGLASRLTAAWQDTRSMAGECGLQIGMDTPQVTSDDLDALLSLVSRSDAVLGPALDGGWWVIGFGGADPRAVFTGVPMSSANTYRAQHERLRRLGLRVRVAPLQRDIDTYEDLVAVAASIPTSRTAVAAAQLAPPHSLQRFHAGTVAP